MDDNVHSLDAIVRACNTAFASGFQSFISNAALAYFGL
jgi:hypothetical protein